MKIVPKTKENLKKCMCMKCPSYNFACKVRAMPGNVILKIGDVEKKLHAEALFCAFEPSHCIDEEKGCNCVKCEVLKENELDKGYFCMVEGGK